MIGANRRVLASAAMDTVTKSLPRPERSTDLRGLYLDREGSNNGPLFRNSDGLEDATMTTGNSGGVFWSLSDAGISRWDLAGTVTGQSAAAARSPRVKWNSASPYYDPNGTLLATFMDHGSLGWGGRP